MLEGLNTAAAGMAAQQMRLDSIANDLANSNTTAYKHSRVGFRDLVYEQAGRASAKGVRTGHGAAAVDAGRAFSQGALQRTDRTLDVSIQGEGFLRVKLANGTQALTRDGNLQIDGRGRLTTASGGLLQPGITLPAGTQEEDIAIGRDGTVSADGRRLGKLDVVTVRAPQALHRLRRQHLRALRRLRPPDRRLAGDRGLEPARSRPPTWTCPTAMVSIIESQRAFELSSKAIQTADQMWEIANGVKR